MALHSVLLDATVLCVSHIYHGALDVIEQEFTRGSNWNLGSGLSLVLMVFILISMAVIAKYDKNGEGTAF